MIQFLENVRAGVVEPHALIRAESTKRSYNLQLCKHRDIENVHTAGVNALDVDTMEGKYLLSGSADGSLHIHDLQNFTGSPHFTSKLICKVDRNLRTAHRYSVECVQWYPFDSGLFITSGMDKQLKIWDTNCMKPADTFSFEGRVFQHHMSHIATRNCLVAVASSVNHVLLVDLKSGSCTHELRGHSSSTLTCRWSPREEYLLATGSCDNKVLLWDVRAAKCCLKSLDQHNGKGRSVSEATNTAHDGYVNGLCFTHDGLFLLSYGTDHRLRLWSTYSGHNEMVNYGKIPNDTKKCMQFDITVSSDPKLVYVPSEGNIFMYEIQSGVKVNTLLGHYNCVNSCIYHPFYHELYSAGNDRNVLIWTADHCQGAVYEEHLKSQNQKREPFEKRTLFVKRNVMADTWSSDEEG